MRKLLTIAALSSIIAGLQAQTTVVIPNGTNGVEAASSTGYPWGRGTAVIHVQYCYDSSHFTLQGISSPIVISELKWRANSTTTTYPGGNNTNVTIDMSTAAFDQASLSTTFASNHGADRLNVFSGTVTVLPTPSVPASTPNIFYVDVILTAPFLYDPSSGNDLLIDVAFPAANWTGSGTPCALDCVTTGSMVSRMYNLSSDTAATGSFQANVGPVVEATYSPATGLYPAFAATPTTGAAPLAVQFTDHTFTSDPGGVLAWQWDFNGDSIIDSTLQNPSFVYNACGDFNVSLTVVDALHGQVSVTRPGLVVVDPIAADFTVTPTSGGALPLIVQFTDASTNATSWAWDLDNDSVVDSTVQNPTWAYVSPGTYSVGLAVNNACRSASVLKPDLILAGSIVVPAAAQSVDGNSSTSYPFDTGAIRVQDVCDASHFIAQGANIPVIISGLRLRANATTTTWSGDVIASLQVNMSTSPVDFLAISSTFASNTGADVTTVYNAPLVIPAGASTAGVPEPFHIDIPFSTPFVYDPNQGDLTIEYISSGVPSTANTPTLDAVSTTGVALARRTYVLTNITSPTGTIWSGEISPVLAIQYTPAAGLFPAFTATPTTGASPLAVQFTDQTFSSDPGGVLAWQWDFDGDNIVDSTLQNPAFVYVNCGSYTVSLTVTDAMHGQVTQTKPNYVVTDAVTADFSYSVQSGGIVQFTDLSSPTPTTWAWDFDGDSIVDSSAQNPTFLFPTQNAYSTTLTASRLCGPPASVTRPVRAALLVSTMFTGGNGGSSGWGAFFDCNVTNPTGVVLTSMDHNISSAASTAFSIDVYITPGSYVGVQTNAAAWRLVSTGSGVGAGSNQPSSTPLSNPVFLAPGSYGIAVYYSGASFSYTNGNGTAIPGSGTNQTFGNADLTLLLGESRTTLFGTTVNTPRIWNGALYYDKLGFQDLAGYTFFAPGCAGSTGMTNLTAISAPVLGQSLSVGLDHLPINLAIMVFGFSRTTSAFGPLPFDLGVVGAPGCLLRVSNDANFVVVGSGNAATWTVPIPNVTGILGMQFFNQAMVLDAAANGLGAVASDAAAATAGR